MSTLQIFGKSFQTEDPLKGPWFFTGLSVALHISLILVAFVLGKIVPNPIPNLNDHRRIIKIKFISPIATPKKGGSRDMNDYSHSSTKATVKSNALPRMATSDVLENNSKSIASAVAHGITGNSIGGTGQLNGSELELQLSYLRNFIKKELEQKISNEDNLKFNIILEINKDKGISNILVDSGALSIQQKVIIKKIIMKYPIEKLSQIVQSNDSKIIIPIVLKSA